MFDMVASSSARPTVYFHVGPPKTGTTYIQGVLRHWQKELKDAGVLFPGIPRHNHFPAALDARGDYGFGYGGGRTPRARAAGAWQRLVKKTKGFDGTVIISHELFASADAEHARAAVRDLAGTDLHLVVTARDPERQLISTWQERIRHGNPQSFRSVLRKVEAVRLSPYQRIPDLLNRWGSTLPADHVHVVTVPPAGSDPTLLWKRFATVIGVDPERFDPSHARRSNKSLGIAEIELLRRVNLALSGRLPHPGYGRIVSRLYAGDILTSISQSPSPTLPEELWPTAEHLSEEWIQQIKRQGYDVSGDLDDLRPRHRKGALPNASSEADVAEAAVQATAELLLEISRLSQPREVARGIARKTATDSANFLQVAARRLKRSRR
jgi:hypothetical protein